MGRVFGLPIQEIDPLPVKVKVYTLGEIFQLAQKEADRHGKPGTVDSISIGVGENRITRVYVDYKIRAESALEAELLKYQKSHGVGEGEFLQFTGILALDPPNESERKP